MTDKFEMKKILQWSLATSIFGVCGFCSAAFFDNQQASTLQLLTLPVPFATFCAAIHFRPLKLLFIPAFVGIWFVAYTIAMFLGLETGIVFGYAGYSFTMCSAGLLGGIGVFAAVESIGRGRLAFKLLLLGAVCGAIFAFPFTIWLDIHHANLMHGEDNHERLVLRLCYALWQGGMGAIVFIRQTLGLSRSAEDCS